MVTISGEPRRRPGRPWAVTLLVSAVLVGGGCGFGDPPGAGMVIVNATNEPLGISEQRNTPRYTAAPGATRQFALSGGEGDCTQWVLSATTADGVVAARTGPPVCSGDQWTITQSQLDEARAAAGKPAPSPSPSHS